jgi:phage baseplate assembly protein V
MKEVIRAIDKMIQPLRNNMKMMVARALLDSVDDAQGIQVVKVGLLADEVSEMERFQNYGFSSNPSKDAEGVCLFVGGNREHGICIALDNREFRLKNLGEGQVALYDEFGSNILLKNDGTISINSDKVEIGADAAEALIKGNVMQGLFNAHTHNVMGVTSSPPVTQLTGSELSTVGFVK